MDINIGSGLLKFSCAVCVDGYDVFYEGNGRSKTVSYLEPRGDTFYWYEPSRDQPDLLKKFIETKPDPDGIESFVTEFGPLGRGSNADLEGGQNISDFVQLHKKTTKVLKAVRESGDNKGSDENLQWVAGVGFSPNIEICIDWNKKPLKFYAKPVGLGDYLILLVYRELNGEVEWRECKNPRCDKMFAVSLGRGALSRVGASTKRKETCGDVACKKALTRLRQKQKKEAQNGER